MACMNHAMNDLFLRIFDLKLVFYPIALFLFCTIIIVPHAIGGEPIQKYGSAAASIAARVISVDQMAEIGPLDSSQIHLKNGFSREMIDTIILYDKLFITMNCE